MTAGRSMRDVGDFLALAWRGLAKGLSSRWGAGARTDFSDVEVVSYPKSGRTWLRLVLDGLGVHLDYQHDQAEVLYTPGQDFDPEGTDFTRYHDRRVVYIERDPRDVIVSSYFQASRRQRVFAGPLGEFLEHPKLGFQNLLRYQRSWSERGPSLPWFSETSYERMHEDPVEELIGLLTRLTVPKIDRRRVARVLDRFRFERMKALEQSGTLGVFYGGKLRPKDPGDPESMKVRRGKVGGYVDYLEPAQIAWCDRLMVEHRSAYAVLPSTGTD
jgi:hypothetical protein